MLDLFKKLGEYPSQTGNETLFLEKIGKYMNQYCAYVRMDKNNLVVSTVSEEITSETLAVFVNCSTDAYMVTGFYDGGFVELRPFGKSRKLYASGQHFNIYGEDNIIGVSDFIKYSQSMHDNDLLTVQTGLDDEVVRKLVSLGDYADVQNPVTSLLNGNIKGGWCGNRSSVVTAIMLMEVAAEKKQDLTLFVTSGAFGAGARYLAEKHRFKRAIVIEPIDSNDGRKHEKPYIIKGFAVNQKSTQSLEETARVNSIPYEIFEINEDSGTIIEKISYAQNGTDVAAVGIPVVRANNSTQTVNTNTVYEAIRLLSLMLGGNISD